MSKAKPLPSQEYLLECFNYNPDTGLLTWKKRPLHHFKNSRGMNIWNARYPSKIAGTIQPNGRIDLIIQLKHYKAHRVIWKIVTGCDPVYEIDHKNINPSDNCWCNLREATHSQNVQNTFLKSSNKTGFKGVHFCNTTQQYQARIMANWKYHHLGFFDTAKEAGNAYKVASAKYHKEFGNY